MKMCSTALMAFGFRSSPASSSLPRKCPGSGLAGRNQSEQSVRPRRSLPLEIFCSSSVDDHQREDLPYRERISVQRWGPALFVAAVQTNDEGHAVAMRLSKLRWWPATSEVVSEICSCAAAARRRMLLALPDRFLHAGERTFDSTTVGKAVPDGAG